MSLGARPSENEPSVDDLVSMPLVIVARAADMLVLHFGNLHPHKSGRGTVGEYALHIQAPWRLDDAQRTITGSGDLSAYAGIEPEPENWGYQDGDGLQDKQLSGLFGPRDASKRWNVDKQGFAVRVIEQTAFGDVRLVFTNGYSLAVFPSSFREEAWRLFRPGNSSDSIHLVFPLEHETQVNDA